MKACYLCKNEKQEKVEGTVRDKPELGILRCLECGLVFLEDFSHIDRDFYKDSKMHSIPIADIENFLTENEPDTKRRFDSFAGELSNKRVLDVGCGAGGFLLKLKENNITDHLAGVEPDLGFREFLNKHDFETYDSADDAEDDYFDYITLFHVLEHFSDPILELKTLKKKLKDNGKIIIEVPQADDALLTLYESPGFSKFTYWSCHLFLFNSETLARVIKEAGFRLDYIKQTQRYGLSNHLFWLAKSKPGGHNCWDFLSDEHMDKLYEEKLAALGKCDTLTAQISK